MSTLTHRNPIVACALVTAALALGACSAGPSTTTTTASPGIATSGGPGTTASGAPTTAVPVTTTAPKKASGELSGNWTGKYHNQTPPASGTFALILQQSDSKLTGSLGLDSSSAANGATVNGTLEGGAIRFGTVGNAPGGTIDYTGSVSGNSMSGTYTDPTQSISGTWSATKIS